MNMGKHITNAGTIALRAGPPQAVTFFVPKKSPTYYGLCCGR
jgi:hypothetical protein